MLKNKIKKIVRIILITIAVLVSARIIVSLLGVTVTGRCAQYVDNYSKYYLYKNDVYIDGFWGGATGYNIWFLPGQKRAMLNKIKEDVHTELTNMVINNSDIIKNYEISNDFRNIYVKGLD